MPKTRILPVVLGLLGGFSVAPGAAAATFAWDGLAGTFRWTDANWTSGGLSGQVMPPDISTTSNGTPWVEYRGHDIFIENRRVEEAVQVRLDGGSLTVRNSTLDLLPSTGSGTLSALNFGERGNPVDVLLEDSNMVLQRSNQTGNAWRIRNGSVTDVVRTTLFVTSEVGAGNLSIEDSSVLSLDAFSRLLVTGGIEILHSDALVLVHGASIEAGWIRINENGRLEFGGGEILLTSSNPFRDTSSYHGGFDWVGEAGSGSIAHEVPSNLNESLASKVDLGFFSINGERIDPSTDIGSGDSVAQLNAELLSLATSDGLYFQIIEDGRWQRLELFLIPEPSALWLLSLALMLCGRRRRSC